MHETDTFLLAVLKNTSLKPEDMGCVAYWYQSWVIHWQMPLTTAKAGCRPMFINSFPHHTTLWTIQWEEPLGDDVVTSYFQMWYESVNTGKSQDEREGFFQPMESAYWSSKHQAELPIAACPAALLVSLGVLEVPLVLEVPCGAGWESLLLLINVKVHTKMYPRMNFSPFGAQDAVILMMCPSKEAKLNKWTLFMNMTSLAFISNLGAQSHPLPWYRIQLHQKGTCSVCVCVGGEVTWGQLGGRLENLYSM